MDPEVVPEAVPEAALEVVPEVVLEVVLEAVQGAVREVALGVDSEVILEGEVQARAVHEVEMVGSGWEEASPFSTVLGSPKKKRKYPIRNIEESTAKQPQSEEASEQESESEEEEEEDEVSSEDESSDDEVEILAVRPYAALMQSLAVEAGPRTKRRKLDHNQQDSEEKLQENKPDDLEPVNAAAEDADHVEEAEEGPETATDGLLQNDDDLEDASDPFESHFADPDSNLLSQRLKSLQKNQWNTKKVELPIGGKAVISIPESDESKAIFTPTSISGPEELKLKQKLCGAAVKQCPSFNELEGSIAPFIFNYQDVLFCDRRPASAEGLRRLACLHAVNHVFKSVWPLKLVTCILTNQHIELETVLSKTTPVLQRRRIMPTWN